MWVAQLGFWNANAEELSILPAQETLLLLILRSGGSPAPERSP